MIVFGVGTLYGIPLTDQTGTAIANPSPVQIGVLQEVAADLSFDEKTLYGAYQFPVAFGRGKGKFTFKAKAADFSYQAMASLFFGNLSSAVAGIRNVVDNFAATVPTTPFQVTITPPSSGTFATDLGVRYASTGLALTRVASAPTTGQYSLSGAIYTFSTGDAGASVLISYEYTATSTTNFQIPVANQLMGYAPSFQTQLHLPYNGKNLTLKLNNCVASKFSLPFKNEDFSVQEFDFMALADASNNIGTISLA
jgi:hypothetical protein